MTAAKSYPTGLPLGGAKIGWQPSSGALLEPVDRLAGSHQSCEGGSNNVAPLSVPQKVQDPH